jgi:cold shock CspA family protein
MIKDVTTIKPGDTLEGKVIKVHPNGWGFITSVDLKFTRIFFHWTGLVQNTKKFPELRIGDKVRFVIQQNQEDAWKAIKIEVL